MSILGFIIKLLFAVALAPLFIGIAIITLLLAQDQDE